MFSIFITALGVVDSDFWMWTHHPLFVGPRLDSPGRWQGLCDWEEVINQMWNAHLGTSKWLYGEHEVKSVSEKCRAIWGMTWSEKSDGNVWLWDALHTNKAALHVTFRTKQRAPFTRTFDSMREISCSYFYWKTRFLEKTGHVWKLKTLRCLPCGQSEPNWQCLKNKP